MQSIGQKITELRFQNSEQRRQRIDAEKETSKAPTSVVFGSVYFDMCMISTNEIAIKAFTDKAKAVKVLCMNQNSNSNPMFLLYGCVTEFPVRQKLSYMHTVIPVSSDRLKIWIDMVVSEFYLVSYQVWYIR